MYQYIVAASLFKSFIPYIRKHVLNTINSHDMLYINALIFFIIVCFIFIYNVIFNKKIISTTINNYNKLNAIQIACLFAISLMAVIVAYLIYELDKFHNTPFINYIVVFSLTIIFSIFISMYIFNEKYNIRHFFGVILTFIGIYLMTSNKIE
jgi:drug/metabolite transporter (DMT)-like permease